MFVSHSSTVKRESEHVQSRCNLNDNIIHKIQSLKIDVFLQTMVRVVQSENHSMCLISICWEQINQNCLLSFVCCFSIFRINVLIQFVHVYIFFGESKQTAGSAQKQGRSGKWKHMHILKGLNTIIYDVNAQKYTHICKYSKIWEFTCIKHNENYVIIF